MEVCTVHDESFARVEASLKDANKKLDRLLSIEGPISAIATRITSVEVSCSQAHHRMDGFENALKSTGNRLYEVGMRVAQLAGVVTIIIMLWKK